MKTFQRSSEYSIGITMLTEEIELFIQRRFPNDSNWCDGNCYYFALILSNRFDGDIYYDSIRGHFVCKINDKFYDYHGEYKDLENLILFNDINSRDEKWYKNLVRDCIL